jgi:hypothetical protein
MLALWVTMGVTLTLTLGQLRPGIALAIWPWGATALASRAAYAMNDVSPGPEQRLQAKDDADRALRQEPGNVAALRVAGVVAAMAGRVHAVDFFVAAERFSRRDLSVQLALIEAAVAKGDIGAAVGHYDRALRTGYRAYDLLFPVLVSASRDPAIARPLGRRLAARPAWWNAFVERAIQSDAPNPMLASLVRQARLRPDRPAERPYLVAALQRLVQQNDIAGAQLLYRDVRGKAILDAPLRDGSFRGDDPLPPFEWQLTDTPDLAAIRESDDQDTAMRLRLVSNGGHDGVLAQQLLVLTAGTYRLTLVAGSVPPEAFSLRVACSAEGRSLVGMPIVAPVGKRQRLTVSFSVPPACRAQWLTIAASGNAGSSQADAAPAWITALAIAKAPS